MDLSESNGRLAITFLTMAIICFAIAYLTSTEPSSIGATRLIEIMVGFGILFSALFAWVVHSAINR